MKYTLLILICFMIGLGLPVIHKTHAQTGSIAYPCNTKPFSLRHSDKDRYILTGLLQTESSVTQVKGQDAFYDEEQQYFYVKYNFVKNKIGADGQTLDGKNKHAIFDEFILPQGVKKLHVFFTGETDETLEYISCVTTPSKQQGE